MSMVNHIAGDVGRHPGSGSFPQGLSVIESLLTHGVSPRTAPSFILDHLVLQGETPDDSHPAKRPCLDPQSQQDGAVSKLEHHVVQQDAATTEDFIAANAVSSTARERGSVLQHQACI